MKRTNRRMHGRNVFDVIEEATHLLRTAPAATLAVYFLGTVPFVLGGLFFWADMSRSPLAPQHLASGSLGMALLFFWMKFWQTVFARRIRAQAAGKPLPPMDFHSGLRILATQARVQPLGLFLLPLALTLVLPFPWVYAYYQNLTVLDDGRAGKPGDLAKAARRQARLWPLQNHALLAVMALFALCVLLNWTTVCLTVPYLGKTLLGIESVYTRSGLAMLNTTFLAAVVGLTCLCVDPVMKTLYTLRCFHGESLESGEDLKAELKPFAAAVPQTIAAILFALALLAASPGEAATNAPAATQTVSVPDLDHAINQTIHENKYTWRMPRDQALEQDNQADNGIIHQFFARIGDQIRDWVRGGLEWLAKVLRKLFWHSSHPTSTPASGYGWIMLQQLLLYSLVAAVVVGLLVLGYRVWRNYRHIPPPVTSEAIPATPPDVADENVHADQLPEDGWTQLARELLARGEFRLAMRAFYLAALAHLAARHLINIARYKSNRDYERELRRRAHAFPGLLATFGENLLVFERTWYGQHEASHELVSQFAAGLEKLKGGE